MFSINSLSTPPFTFHFDQTFFNKNNHTNRIFFQKTLLSRQNQVLFFLLTKRIKKHFLSFQILFFVLFSNKHIRALNSLNR